MKADLAKLRALLAAADAQDVWMLATSNSWRRVLTIFGKPVIVPCVDHDGHPNMDSLANIELAVEAVNALPELLAIAEAVERADVWFVEWRSGDTMELGRTDGGGKRVRVLAIGEDG